MILIAAVVLICGLGAAALMHRNSAAADPVAVSPMATFQSSAPQAVNAETAYSGSDGYYPSTPRPVYVRQQPIQPVQYAGAAPYREREVYRDGRVYRHGRSKEHSVEIVAGTAAVGAAIGAIAGGGKGAAIGAVSGGGAGFAYDRLTHNR